MDNETYIIGEKIMVNWLYPVGLNFSLNGCGKWLKLIHIYNRNFKTKNEAKSAIFEYI